MYKCLVLDVDGTLLNTEGIVSELDIKAINKLQSKDIKVVLNTGRHYNNCSKIIKNFPLLDGIICLQGAVGIDLRNKEVFVDNPIPSEIVQKILDFSVMYNINIHISFEDKVYRAKENNEIIHMNTEMADVEQLRHMNKNKEVYHISLPGNDGKKIFLNSIWDTISSEVDGYVSRTFGVYIYKKNVNKGNAMKKLRDYYNIEKRHIISVGDADIDISMFHESGLSIAIREATENTIKAATIRIDRDKINPIAHIVDLYFN